MSTMYKCYFHTNEIETVEYKDADCLEQRQIRRGSNEILELCKRYLLMFCYM